MDATGTWHVTVRSPLGRIAVEVVVDERGGITAYQGDQRVDVQGAELTPEGDGLRFRWTQQLAAPLRLRVAVDALAVGDRLTGTARGGALLPAAHLEGVRVR